MLRRDIIQAIVQAILFAIFGRFAKRLPAHVVENVERAIFKSTGQISICIKGWEITEKLERTIFTAIPDDEFRKLIGYAPSLLDRSNPIP